MVIKVSLSLVFLLSFILRTCSSQGREYLPADKFVQWVENPENGLLVEKTVDTYTFSAQYRPAEYVVLQDERRSDITLAEMNEKKKAFSKMQYFTFRISATEGGDLLRSRIATEQDYFARLEYFSSAMQQDIKLIEGNDTLDCLMFHYERSYGIDPRSAFVLAFQASDKINTDKTLLFNDQVLGTGPVMITMSTGHLNKIPSLTLDQP